MKKYLLLCAFAAPFSLLAQSKSQNNILEIVFTSDLHYGYHRASFAGEDSVAGNVVNTAMVQKINALPTLSFPNDDGVAANKKMGYVDYVFITGDIANRQQIPLQNDATSWNQFRQEFMGGLHTKNAAGTKTVFLLTPGNHDASNAIGYYKPMMPLTDATSMVEMYNLMMQPKQPKTTANFNYDHDKINYSKDIAGIHFMFVQLWPDSVNRVWMEQDLKHVSNTTPVLLFTHVAPFGDVKHFNNPFYPYTINDKDKFENLLPERLSDSIQKNKTFQDLNEQRSFAAFIKRHPNIKAYFHGHENFTEFYNYKGPDENISLPVFRVDSPMKGEHSAKDETLLSFETITIDTKTKTMTVREYFWNNGSDKKNAPSSWGKVKTISLK